MERNKIILVPIDSNEQTIIALSQSYNLSKLTSSKIVLLSIDDGNAPNIKNRLQELSEEAKQATGQPVETIIRKGKSVFQEITKVANELNPLFIIIGIGRIRPGNFRGENALELIRKSEHPIISIGGKNHKNGCNKILMPLDLTMLSREKVPGAIQFAKLFNSSIQIVSIIKDESKIEENKLHMFANQCLKFIKEAGISAESKFIKSNDDIATTVLNYAKEIDADLIIIASNRDRSIKEFFTGTAAQRLINNSEIPVLTLRPLERRDTSQSQSVY